MAWSLLSRSPFDTLFSDLLGEPAAAGSRLSRGLEPRFLSVSVREDGDRVVLESEIPGVRREDIELTVDGKQLHLTVERRAHELNEGDRLHRRERASGKFSRSIELPYRLDPESASATYERGVLTVHLERTAEDRPRKIAIRDRDSE